MSETPFPNFDLLSYLTYCVEDQYGCCEHLIEYDGTRYHFVLEYNTKEEHSAENKYLRNVYDVLDSEDDDRVEDEIYACLDIFWPHLKAVHTERVKTCTESVPGTVIKTQLVTIAGKLEAVTHDRYLKYPVTEPVANSFPHVPLFPKDDVQVISNLAYQIFKVKSYGVEYCMKTVHRRSEQSFLREVDTLSKLVPGHPNVTNIVAVVGAENGKIDAFLTPYIHGPCLAHLKCIKDSQRTKWKKQIEDAVMYLHHRRNVVWGDAKPHNVIVDEENDNVILIDFGGGTTKGWVDHELSGTKQGDLQGVKRIVEFLDHLDTETETSCSQHQYRNPS